MPLRKRKELIELTKNLRGTDNKRPSHEGVESVKDTMRTEPEPIKSEDTKRKHADSLLWYGIKRNDEPIKGADREQTQHWKKWAVEVKERGVGAVMHHMTASGNSRETVNASAL